METKIPPLCMLSIMQTLWEMGHRLRGLDEVSNSQSARVSNIYSWGLKLFSCWVLRMIRRFWDICFWTFKTGCCITSKHSAFGFCIVITRNLVCYSLEAIKSFQEPATGFAPSHLRLFKLPFFDSIHEHPDYRTIFNPFQIQEEISQVYNQSALNHPV